MIVFGRSFSLCRVPLLLLIIVWSLSDGSVFDYVFTLSSSHAYIIIHIHSVVTNCDECLCLNAILHVPGMSPRFSSRVCSSAWVLAMLSVSVNKLIRYLYQNSKSSNNALLKKQVKLHQVLHTYIINLKIFTIHIFQYIQSIY